MNRTGRTGQECPFEEHNVGGIALDGRAQVLQGVCLRHHPEIVFEREDLANPHTINGLGIRENNADHSRLNLSVQGFVFGRIFKKFHTQLRHCQARASLFDELILVNCGGNLGLGLAHGAAYHTSMAMNQNIVSCAQDRPRHAQGKVDPFADPQRAVQFK